MARALGCALTLGEGLALADLVAVELARLIGQVLPCLTSVSLLVATSVTAKAGK